MSPEDAQEISGSSHTVSDMCKPCGNVKKGFDAICKQQGTYDAMCKLRQENLEEWLVVLRTFRDQRGDRGTPRLL